jgi:hypothetical protein
VSYDGWNTDGDHTLTLAGGSWNAGDEVELVAGGHAPFNSGSVGTKYLLRSGQNQVIVTVSGYTDASHVDATLETAPHASLQNAALSDWALATGGLGGLWHLEGRELAILADGSVQPTAAVVDGSITLPRACGRVVAGLPYTCDLQTLNIEVGQPTLQGRQKVINEVTLRVKDTRGLSVGPTADRLVDIKERGAENFGCPTLLATGDEKVLIDPSWNTQGRVFVRQSNPLPATVVAIIPKLEAGA